jgi:hypothetical protein
MHHKKRGLGDLRWERRKKHLLASRYKEQQINSTLIESSTLGGGHLSNGMLIYSSGKNS